MVVLRSFVPQVVGVSVDLSIKLEQFFVFFGEKLLL